jgi:uncharacterized protein
MTEMVRDASVDQVSISATGVVDVDIHPSLPRPDALMTYLSERWRRHTEVYGTRTHTGWAYESNYPPYQGRGLRADAWPESGPPGSDLELMREQLLDPFGIEFGVLDALDVAAGQLNQEYAAALARALNDFQLEHFVEPEPRLKLAMVVPYESPDLSATEIERIAGHPGVVSIFLMAQSLEPFGRRRYWPIYEAAVAHDLPVLIHLSSGGGHPNTPNGWGSYHTEYHIAHVQCFQAQFLSLICEGVFETFPTLKVILAEGGIAWIPAMLRRLDYHWKRLRSELPNLHRRPSEYVDDHLWVATQPLDEPDDPRHLIELFEELGIGNILFSTDYPHFDFDSPTLAFPKALRPETRARIMRDNGVALFGLARGG